ncbi:DUF2062 domain-containing protein [Halonotius roseus]|uniref:DUF2062 domain-containing protein n=1 Tax=Halonotius roseus TaxID=2511997 RepID=A0A544QLD6_9EURY|nr:DUF2062 domain-containing protein [Halonotius roseus]TQQ79382.1 DUF2062 domain-containing protein [Halonotius roseus]
MRWPRIARLRRVRNRVRDAIEASFDDDQSPEQIAGSFAIGVFLTTLPTLGGNLVLMVILASRVAWINTVALFSSGIVINPLVKWGIYALSVPLGIYLLGPIDGGIAVELSLSGNRPLLVRLVVGCVILAVVATAISYGLVRGMVVAYRRRNLTLVEEVADIVVREIDPSSDPDTTIEIDRPSDATDSVEDN